MWGLCFGRAPLAVASWLALAPLLLLLGQRHAARLGWLHGFAFWLVSMSWIVPTLESFGRLPTWLAVVAMLFLALYLGSFTLVFAWIGRRLWHRGGATALLGLPALWVALEWLRNYQLFSGFPWNLAGYAWESVPGALELSAWIGIYGISFLVLLVNTAVARAFAARRPHVWLTTAGACLVLLAFGARWAGGPPLSESGPGRPVRLIQPNIPNQVDWNPAEANRHYQRLLELSDEACDEPGALVIWPEGAAFPRSWDDAGLRADLSRFTQRGCTVLINSVSREGEQLFNSALIVGPSGLVGSYHKRHLVPYGEYVPLAGVVPFVGTVARMAGQFSAGSEETVLPWGEEGLGVSICFEVIFTSEVAALVRAGATLLVTITNDAWYGDTSAPWQHFRAARFRAAENRRPVLRAALTGVSALIDARGAVVAELGVGEEGVLRGRLAGNRELTLYSRAPFLTPLLAALLAAFAIVRGWRAGAAAGTREGES